MRRPTRHIALLLAALALLLACSCSDEFGSASYVRPGTLTLRLVTGAPDARSRADMPDSPDMLSPATEDERRITDLRLFAFPVDGGELLRVSLAPLPSADETADERYKDYVIENVHPGKYRIYVVANQPSCAAVKTEEELKKHMLDYHADGLPRPGSLPMVYEPRETTEITPGGTSVTANLQFTCVKVRYSLIFDKDNNPATAKAFGKTGLLISAVKGVRLTTSTPLVLGAAMEAVSSGESFDTQLPAGRYFADWSENRNASGDEDVIAVSGTDAPASYADRWVYQGTLYLPERYIGDDSRQSELAVEALTVDASLAPEADGTIAPTLPPGSVNTYRIPLGHCNADGQPRQFPRGTYYEIIGHIETAEPTGYLTDVRVRDWEPVGIAGFNHTTLAVDKTRASVGSLDYDSICYMSNAAEVIMGCDDVIEGKPVIVQYLHNVEKGILSFRINPEIPVSAFREGTDFPPHGLTKVWIQANNLRKYLDVEYDVEAMLVVKPHDVIINWLEDTPESQTYVKTFSYETNLGGIDFVGHDIPFTLSSGLSDIRIECDDPGKAIGTFTVTAACNPVHEAVHEFTVGPHDAGFEQMRRLITVTVKPPVGNYRIHFRAINDRQGALDTNSSPVTFSLLEEGGDNNWNDGWEYQNIYAYTQIGETVGQNIPEYYVWRFSSVWPGDPIVRSDFPGWYLKEYATDETAENKEAGSSYGTSIKTIKPGETLLMFNSDYEYTTSEGKKVVVGTRHHCTHAFDPGIQLFDYEDREGWILYDPLTQEPYYAVSDARPEIHDVNYTVYSDRKPVSWYRKYGKGNLKDGVYEEYHIRSDIRSVTAGKDASGKTWYKATSIVLKAPEGRYDKAITIVFADGSSSVIFAGADYADGEASATGTYGNGVWKHGAPALTETARNKTVFYHNTKNWSFVNAYCWNNSSKNNDAQWPGLLMRPIGNNWYVAEVDSDYDMIIFNNRNEPGSVQTSDLPMSGTQEYYYYDFNGTTSDRP